MALDVEQVKTADMRKRCELGPQHLVCSQGRHLPFKTVGGIDPARLHMGDDIVVDMLEIAELLVKMTGQKQRAVRQFPLADLERALAKLQSEVSRAQRNRDHERGT